MFKKIFRSPFIKSILTLVTGSSIAQAITLLVTPILSRIYSPADFGVFTFFMAIVGAFALIATLRYEIAIMLPKKDQEAVNIVSLSLIINALCRLLAVANCQATTSERTLHPAYRSPYAKRIGRRRKDGPGRRAGDQRSLPGLSD